MAIVLPIGEQRKLRLRIVRSFVQGHTDSSYHLENHFNIEKVSFQTFSVHIFVGVDTFFNIKIRFM